MPASSRERPHRDQRTRMLEEPVPRLVLTLAVPTIISMMVTSIYYNMADTYFVSQINTSASGAVGIVFSIMAIIQAVGFTIGMGSGSVASRLLGQGLPGRAAVIASSAVVSALVCGGLLTLAGLLSLERFVWILGATETIYPYALQYATYILWGAPVMCLAFTLNNLLRWQGKANRSVIGLGIGGVLNIFLDPIFIFGLDLGISGAAIATLLSQCVSASILASFFLRGQSRDPGLDPLCLHRAKDLSHDFQKRNALLLPSGDGQRVRHGAEFQCRRLWGRGGGRHGDRDQGVQFPSVRGHRLRSGDAAGGGL